MKRNRSTAALVPSPAIHRRLFLVGCPGCGAALLQQLLAEHPALHSFPRSHLFLRTFGMRGRRLPWTWFGITVGKERRILQRLAESESESVAPALPPRSMLLRRSLDALLATFDRLALAAGCRNWLDTTPRQLVHACLIERMVPRSRIIHVVRDGRDVVAAGCARGRDPRAVVAEWNRALELHARCMGRRGHVFILYEDLLADPCAQLGLVLQQCGIQYEPDELARIAGRVLDTESGMPGGNRNRASIRLHFREAFSASRRRKIERSLHLDRYGMLAERLRRQQVSIPASDPYAGRSAAGASGEATMIALADREAGWGLESVPATGHRPRT